MYPFQQHQQHRQQQQQQPQQLARGFQQPPPPNTAPPPGAVPAAGYRPAQGQYAYPPPSAVQPQPMYRQQPQQYYQPQPQRQQQHQQHAYGMPASVQRPQGYGQQRPGIVYPAPVPVQQRMQSQPQGAYAQQQPFQRAFQAQPAQRLGNAAPSPYAVQAGSGGPGLHPPPPYAVPAVQGKSNASFSAAAGYYAQPSQPQAQQAAPAASRGPQVPVEFPELDACRIDDLQDMLVIDSKRDEFVKRLPIGKELATLTERRDVLKASVASVPDASSDALEIKILKNEAEEITKSATECQERHRSMEARRQVVLRRQTPAAIIDSLEAAGDRAEATADTLEEAFRTNPDSVGGLPAFITQFTRERAKYHRLQQLLGSWKASSGMYGARGQAK